MKDMTPVRALGSVYGDYKLIAPAYPAGFMYDKGQEDARDVLAAHLEARRVGGPLVLLRYYAQGWICEAHESN